MNEMSPERAELAITIAKMEKRRDALSLEYSKTHDANLLRRIESMGRTIFDSYYTLAMMERSENPKAMYRPCKTSHRKGRKSTKA